MMKGANCCVVLCGLGDVVRRRSSYAKNRGSQIGDLPPTCAG